MSEQITIQTITTVGLIVIAWLGNRKLNRIGGDAREARNQTANTHNTNLRDDLDAVRDDVTAVRGEMAGIARSVSRIDQWAEDLSRSDAELERTIDRRRDAAALEVHHLREEIPALIHTELTHHIAACPLRNPPGGTS